jgi:hypothetical protein
MDEFFSRPMDKFEELQLVHLSRIYDARKRNPSAGSDRYANLLIEKFAIHSATLFHILNGLIEHPHSNSKEKKVSFDLFTVNSLIRVLMETYVSFHHLFVYPKTNEERDFKLLLWKLEGLFEKKKFRVPDSALTGVKETLSSDEAEIQVLHDQIEKHVFRNQFSPEEYGRIHNLKNKIAHWRFLHKQGKVRLLKIIDLVEFTCPMSAFFNLYRYASMHTHSGYVSIKHFEKVRGRLVSERYVNNFPRTASILIIFLINDLIAIDVNANAAFNEFHKSHQEEFKGINHACRVEPALLSTDNYCTWR